MRYRPEVDGLRAVAVVPVIFFHAGIPGFSGGFVGVDVFFVISGYLITSLIAADLAQGKFSLSAFYGRRARRILPALFVVCAATLPFAAAWTTPEQRKGFYQSLAAVSVFASNFLFWRQSGYFDSSAELKPLLHTWSLAVEEQYYVLFPVFLMVVWKLGRFRVIGIVAAAGVVSLVLAQWGALNSPSGAFYLLPTRAWELLVGVLIALGRVSVPTRMRGMTGLAGLAMIGYAVCAFDKYTLTPGFATLIPTLGAAAILVGAQPNTFVQKLLAAPTFAGIGLLSYSAYVWHQPIFAFARMRDIDALDMRATAALIVLTFALAYLTWRFVETPFRRQAPGRRIVSMAAAGTLGFATFGIAAAMSVPFHAPSEPTNGRCNVGALDCFAIPGAPYQVALWGDSFADALAVSLAKKLAAQGVSLRLFVANSCPSLVGVLRNEPGARGAKFAADCVKHNEEAVRRIRQLKIDYVVLTSAYEYYLSGKNASGEPLLTDPSKVGAPPLAFLSARLADTVRALGTARTLIVMPHPTVTDFPRERKQLQFGERDQIYADYAAATRTREVLRAQLGRVQFDELDARQFLCAGEACPIVGKTHELLLYDGAHLSRTVADRVAAAIVDRISRARASQP